MYTTDENGVLTIDGLYEYVEGRYITGEYRLVEIYAPEGYSLNSTELKFKAYRENGTLKIEIIEGQDVIRVIETKDAEREEAKKLADKLTKITVRVEVKAGENGKIFGGVSAKDISENLEKQHKIKIDKKKIDLKETIKTLGMFSVDVKLYEGVLGKIKVDVRG